VIDDIRYDDDGSERTIKIIPIKEIPRPSLSERLAELLTPLVSSALARRCHIHIVEYFFMPDDDESTWQRLAAWAYNCIGDCLPGTAESYQGDFVEIDRVVPFAVRLKRNW